MFAVACAVTGALLLFHTAFALYLGRGVCLLLMASGVGFAAEAVSVHTFGSQTVTAGTFTLTMPANTTTTALIRLATT